MHLFVKPPINLLNIFLSIIGYYLWHMGSLLWHVGSLAVEPGLTSCGAQAYELPHGKWDP